MTDHPAEFVGQTADQLLTTNPTPAERATAELLNYIADTWEQHYVSVHDHALAVARAYRNRA